MLPQKFFVAGVCDLCGAAAITKWTDPEMLGVYGDCCYKALIMADISLRGFKRPGGAFSK